MTVPLRRQAIHTALRRYLPARSSEISAIGAQLPKAPYQESEAAQRIIPRYGYLRNLNDEIERLDPEALPAEAELLEQLRLEAMTVPTDIVVTTDAERAALDEERERTVAAIDDLAASDLSAVEPLPYRRTLSEQEAQSWSRAVADRWLDGGADWWLPFKRARSAPSDDAVILRADAFFGDAAVALRRVLVAAGQSRVIALREWGVSREHAAASLEPVYSYGREALFTSGDASWLLHASHEDRYTLVGWVVPALKSSWPEWPGASWRDWTNQGRTPGS